jgi:hypothetical protein
LGGGSGRGGCAEGRRSPQDEFVWRPGIDLGLIAAVAGARDPSTLRGVVCVGCQLALGFPLGVVDPRAKRRFWD